jgi:NAD(P)-dependent dehydrogenase (short-subunit alcohol dehydrogenase family)
MTHDYEGRHVVVTGGTGGLGTAVIETLLESGAVCHVPYRGAAGTLAGTTDERLRLVPSVDLTVEADVASFYADLPPLWASIHLTGAFSAGSLADTQVSDVQSQFETNAITCFLCCREAVRAMRAKSPPSGRVVNVTARPALVPTAGLIAYSMAKSAVLSLTTGIAEELKQEGILVNAIAPSIIDTPANRRAMPDADYSTWPTATEVAAAILFLASPRNYLTTGAVIPVYGRA